MASLRMLAFDHEGRPLQFDTWLDDLQLYLLSDSRDSVSLFDLDYDAILSAMYSLSASAEGDCYWCVLPDPGIEAAALGASESSIPGTAPAEALHTSTLDSGASHCFFRDSTTLTPLPAPVSVSASGQVALPCSCCLLSHQTLLWHHRLGHPSLPRLRGMHSRLLVSGPSRSLPPLPPSPAPPCLPCVEGRHRAAPHSSSFPPTIAPLQTLHMDVWGPARLRERFHEDLLVLRLHFARGGEFSSDLFWDIFHGEGILQLLTLPASPQQNGIAERHIAPHFLWPFAFRYAAHQLSLWPRVSLPETSSTLRWTGEVGDASVFRVSGSRAFVRDTSADKLSARAIPCVFLGFRPNAPGWQFYHPTSRRVFPSQDVTFDESVPFYRLFPYRSAPPQPPPLFLAPGPPPVDHLLPQGTAPSGLSQVDPLPGTVPVEVAGDPGAARGAVSVGAAFGGAKPGGAEPGGAESEGAGSEGAEPVGAEHGGAEPRGTASSGGPAGASPQLSPRPEPLSRQQLREWFTQRTRLRSGAAGAGDSAAGDNGAGGAAGSGTVGGTGAGDPTEPGAAGAGGPGTGGTRAGGAGAVGARARGTGAGDSGAGGAGAGGAVSSGTDAGGTVRPRPYFVPLLQQVLVVPSSTGLTPPLLCPPPNQSQPSLQPASPLSAPSPYTEETGGLTERREPASCPASPVRTCCRVPRPRPPPVPGTHAMALRPSSVPLRVPLPPPLESSLPAVPDPESDRARAASPTVSRLLARVVTDPSFESTAASADVTELVDFAVACRLDYASALVAESESAGPPSLEGECALGTYILEVRQEDFECLAAAVHHFASMLLAPEGDPDPPDISTPRSYAEASMGPYSSQWQAAMDAKMASWKSTGFYVDALPPSRANIVNGMWIFRVKRPPGSLPTFKARYVARGFTQRQGVDYFQTFSPTLKMTTLRLLLHWSLRRPVYGLRQAPREWHNTLKTTLAALGFTPSTADLSLFLGTDMSLPPFYVLVYVDDLVFATADTKALTRVLQRFGFQFSSPQLTPLSTGHSLSAPPSDESIEPSGPYPELVGCLITSGMGLVLGGRCPFVLTGHTDASWVDDSATQRSSQGYTFSLGSGSVSWRSTRSSSVLSSSCEAEIYAGAMAAQELRWLTYLLTDLGEQPRSPLQRGQLRLAYVATRANTADVFTKALLPADH
ncbi:unnamed protein product [Closterium sp. NIES-53]